MTGLTDGTKPGTRVTDSYMASSRTLPFLVDAASPYRLYQKRDGVPLRWDGVPVGGGSGAHDLDPPMPGQLGLFSVAAEFEPGTTRIELVNTLTSPETVLYSADRNPSPPSVGGIGFSPGAAQNLTQYRVKARFDPQVLNPTSGGRTVTVTLDRAPRPWSEIDPATVRLRLPGAAGCAPLDVPLAGNGWQPGADQTTAKIDRQVVTRYLVDSCHLRDQRVPLSVTGNSGPQHGTWKFEASTSVHLQ